MNRQCGQSKVIKNTKRHVLTEYVPYIFAYSVTIRNIIFACFCADLNIIVSQLQINVNLFCKKIIKQARKMRKQKFKPSENQSEWMEGHGKKRSNIYKRRDGRFEGRVSVGYKENGKSKYRYVYGHSLAKVKEKMAQVYSGQKTLNSLKSK